ncbi:oxidoreductase [Sandarakinorhabdus cyanobacteriorum]|uniref:Oxidoreductase n=1 Tax=Sandarakinorhabdus cyanobacteriorum TaxID=1981098 RepID=A0A255YQ51_9SPHN|nr:SDR family oxidoreductase [Sandarakinorhabdus cyanobacteriorum]OYQ30804.1 oxidoreductase [Sandarakinorhabdus cyanobacteriorum]
MTDFAGKQVMVMGGSRGIGAAIVRQFVAAGASVRFTFSGSPDAAAAVAAETGATAVQADSANRDAVIAAVADAGALDVLVINAGVAIMGDPLTLDPDAVDRLIDINVRAVYFAGVEAGRQMRDNGRILIIGSVNGDRVPWPGQTAYALSKSAVQGIARGLARDFGPRGITVNVVQPGPVDTDMNPAEGPFAKMMHAAMAIKRHATADEVASLVLYLASPAAAMITGTTQTIDGGVGI